MRVFGWSVLVVVLFVLGAAVWVLSKGVPDRVVRHYVAPIEAKHAVRISAGRVYWRPWHQVRAADVKVSTLSGKLAAEAKTVSLDLSGNPDAPSDSPWISCRLEAAKIRIVPTEPGEPPAIVDFGDGEVTLSPRGVVRFDLDVTPRDNWNLLISGKVDSPPGRPSSPSPQDSGSRLDEAGLKAYQVLRSIESFNNQDLVPKSLCARVVVDGAAGTSTPTVRAWVEGGGVKLKQLEVARFSAALHLTNGVLDITSGRLLSAGSSTSVEGRLRMRPPSGDLSSRLRIRTTSGDLAALGLIAGHAVPLAGHAGPFEAHVDATGNLRDLRNLNLSFEVSSVVDAAMTREATLSFAKGRYAEGKLQALEGRLQARDVNALLPEAWRQQLADAQVQAVTQLTADVSFAPGPIDSVARNLRGRLTCDSLQYRGTRLAPVAVDFQRHGDVCTLAGATATIADQAGTCSVSARGTLVRGGGYDFLLESDANPSILAGLLPPGVAPLIASNHVAGTMRSQVRLLTTPDATNLVVLGSIHATRVSRHQVAADLVTGSFKWTENALEFNDVVVVGDDVQFRGRFAYQPAASVLSIKGQLSGKVKSFARFADPALEKLLGPYRLEGPITVDSQGYVGLKDNPERDLRVHVEGKDMGWRWFLADEASLDIALGTATTRVDILKASWCGGNVTGAVQVAQPPGTNRTDTCKVALRVDNADLARAVDIYRDLQEEDATTYKGRISGHLELAGVPGPEFMVTGTGSGGLTIEDGYILSIPVFGGLSKHLSLLIPGFGYASQRDFKGTFTIGNGRLETTDSELLGRLVSIRGNGSYTFGKDIDGRLRVQFLKEGITATVTRLITSPLTKALEFEVSGPATDPEWRLVNSPAKLIKFFSDNLGKLNPFGRDDQEKK